MPPPLSYALAATRPDELTGLISHLPDLKSLGFRWITLMPTWLVVDEIPPRIDLSRSPQLAEIAAAVSAVVESGLNLKLEPHLDWETTLTGGPYDWRRRMYIAPNDAYADRVIAPLFGLAVEAAASGAECALTLGSELDVSLAEFAPEWEALFRALQPRAAGVTLGHNINHDSLNPGTDIRKPLNAERARRGLPPLDWRAHRERTTEAHRYLSRLDYSGFSFYPDARTGRSDQWWRAATTQVQVRIVGRAFQKQVQTLTSRLRRSAGDKPQFAIGEFGIGCTDPSRPWHFDAGTFLSPDGSMDRGARELRRKYYMGLLECLRKAPHLFASHPVTFWTMTHYDFLGALGYAGCEAFRDDVLRDAVVRYNELP
ncbi:MAG TPA: hypothetical protein VFL57_14900 [Bryobacteraceae bacterium]|nr:hypothetical protein [Bryobacteraceae bacterium]